MNNSSEVKMNTDIEDTKAGTSLQAGHDTETIH